VDRHRDRDWIVNSRNDADERVVAALAAHAGFTPRIAHRADSLDLVQDLVAAGLGVGLLPEGMPMRAGVRLLRLREPEVLLRAFTVVGRGRAAWAPLALILRSLIR
jgi:DNA-binding transcriptional LysR family regulator